MNPTALPASQGVANPPVTGPPPGLSEAKLETKSKDASISNEKALKRETVVVGLDAAFQVESQALRSGTEIEQTNTHRLESLQFVEGLSSSVASSTLSNISNLTMLKRKVKGRCQTGMEFSDIKQEWVSTIQNKRQ